MASEAAKALKVKTGVVERLAKEVLSYHSEAARDEQRLQEKRSEGADEHDLKQLENVRSETLLMIRGVTERLEAAIAELEAAVEAGKNDESKQSGSETEIRAAEEALTEGRKVLKENKHLSHH